ncbi:MAG TPA: homoserine kinase [Ktedonobacterales bacterium]|nr:homoserine kinase [Ktedonobacterales bacterium]
MTCLPMFPWVRAFAPATVANVGSGFDVLGFAVEAPGDEVVACPRDEPGVTISTITGDGGRLPRDAAANTAGAAALALLAHIGAPGGVELELHKRMPLGSGLGSSAASAVAAAVAVNALFGAPLTRAELLPCALAGEEVSCAPSPVHADNVVPSLMGGFTLIRSTHPLDVVSLPAPATLACALVHPDLEVRTADARAILPRTVALADAVTQWGNIAGIVAGLFMSDFALIGRSVDDVIVEPVRSSLIPGFADVKRAALETGALGCGISGACPTLFALCDTFGRAQAVGDAIRAAFARHGLASDVYVSGINREGARLVEHGPPFKPHADRIGL